MKKSFKIIILCLFAILFSTFNFGVAAAESVKVYLGGYAAGFSLTTEGAEVVGICDVITENGLKSPAKDAGIIVGDVILEIGDITTDNALDVKNAVADGGIKSVKIKRNNEIINGEIMPEKDMSGQYKLGVFIRDDINGIGTITFFTDKNFGALGHPVISHDGGVMKITGGKLYKCSITGAVKGERGKAGELKGVFVGNPCGKITSNTVTGVYGNANTESFGQLKKVSVGDGVIGDALIYSTVGDAVKEYKISIVKVDKDNNSNKNYVIKIRDNELIGKTGGIVQGMSGSPIVQNGRLVGAVTHVFINDPTRGFAISINKMLENLPVTE